MQAGELRDRVTFAAQAAQADDGFGNVTADGWTDQFTVAARVRPLLGSEAVMAARLAGRQPVVITVRDSTATRQVTTDWRAQDARAAARVYNVRTVISPEPGWLDFLCESGVAI